MTDEDLERLRVLVGDLTVTQVARALQCAQGYVGALRWQWHLTDDEKAIAAWTEPT